MRALHPFVDAIEQREDCTVSQITAWTKGGRAMGARLFGSERVVRAPLPAPPFAARFLRAVRPDVLVLKGLSYQV